MIENFDNNDIITISDSAKSQLNLLSKEGNIEIKFGIEPSGCSGYSYVWEIFEGNKENYIKIEATEKASIFIEKKAIPHLNNIEIDYKKEDLQENFVFNNPNITKECGCGESFNID